MYAGVLSNVRLPSGPLINPHLLASTISCWCDLSTLPNSVSLAGTFNGFDKAHNILLSNIDYSTGEALPGFTVFAYILGAQPGGGAFRILDLSNPVAPVEITPPPPDAGSSHDAATMIVTGA